jgi:hypothetical protein
MKDRRLNQAQAESGISVDMYRNSHSDAKKMSNTYMVASLVLTAPL